MTYSIEFTPDRLTVTADLATEAEIAELIRAITVVTPLIGPRAAASDELTRVPRRDKKLRVEKAEKEIRPEPRKPAAPDVVTRPERNAPPPASEEADDQRVVVRRTSASVPEDRDEKLRQLWATDLTLNQIADKLGLHFTTVSQRAKYLGLPSRKGRARRTGPVEDDGFDPTHYARHAIIPDAAAPASGAEITAALMGDPSHGPSVGVERAGMQRDGGGA